MTMLWIGTYPSAGFGTPTGRGEGVWRVELDPLDGMLGIPHPVVTTPAPSFVVTHPDGRSVYAVDESAPGELDALPPLVAIHRVIAPADGRDLGLRSCRRDVGEEGLEVSARAGGRRVAPIEEGVDRYRHPGTRHDLRQCRDMTQMRMHPTIGR